MKMEVPQVDLPLEVLACTGLNTKCGMNEM